jgi:hypothetical protein
LIAVTALAANHGRDPVNVVRLRRACLATLLLLVLQFVLGIATNLFVTVPEHHAGAHPHSYLSGSVHSIGWAFAHGAAVLVAHTLLGFVLVLSALGVFVQAMRFDRRRRFLALFGWACIVGAGFNGASFLDFVDNSSSFIMALLFAVALSSYVLLLYLAGIE